MNQITKNSRTALQALLAAALLLPVAAMADSGFYIGGSIGNSTVEFDTADIGIPSVPLSYDEDDSGYKLFGGYRFDLPVVEFGIEAGYVDFGNPGFDILGDPASIAADGFNLWGIAGIGLGPLDLYGKIGYLAWDAEAVYQGLTSSDDDSDLGYGIGLAFWFGPVQFRGEFEAYDLDAFDLSMLSVGVAYQFN